MDAVPRLEPRRAPDRLDDRRPERSDGTGTIRVFLLDDHELVRCGLRQLLSSYPDLVVVGESASAREAIRRIPALRPHVMVLDARLPDGSGTEVCREVRAVDPSISGIILTSYADDSALVSALSAGAAAFLLKDVRGHQLVEAIRRVSARRSMLDATSAQRLRRAWGHAEPADPVLDRLTPQERRILDGIGEGLTNRQIGERLCLAEKTVKNYVTSVLDKLGLERRTQAAVYVVAHRRAS